MTCKINFAFVFFSITAYLILLGSAEGQVYRHVDAAGNVTYSSTPGNGEAPAELPSIQHENISTRINKIKTETPPNCSKHGGVDCSKPADGDGSVICGDGFRDASLPYALTCLEARLISDLSITIGQDSLPVRLGSARGIRREDKARVAAALDKGDSLTIKVSLRNMTAKAANGIGVHVRLPDKNKVDLAGSDRVEPFAAEYYEYSLGSKPEVISPETLRRIKLYVDCANCSAVSAAIE
jgi:hypothetical protein